MARSSFECTPRASRRIGRGLGLVLAVLVAACVVPACEPLGPSKVAAGQRYASGDTRYDPYFESVHREQVAAASWQDEQRAARKPLINTLGLTPDASEDVILSATRERAKRAGGAKLDVSVPRVTPSGPPGDGALFVAVEEMARLELELARKRRATQDKLVGMAKSGEGLKSVADTEYENRGAQKADEEKTKKHREIRRELGGAISATRSLANDAARDAREIDELLEDVGRALESAEQKPRTRTPKKAPSSAAPAPKPVETTAPKPVESPPPKPTSKPAPKPPKPVDKPVDKPVEKPAPKPPPSDEVFNP